MKNLLPIIAVLLLASCSKQTTHRGNNYTPGYIITVAGNGVSGFSGDHGPADSAELNYPGGVAVDAAGNIYIADGSNNRIRKVSASGVITTVAGNGSQGFGGDSSLATAAQLDDPMGVAVDNSGNLYIADANNNRIRKVNTAGIITTIAGKDSTGYNGDGFAATYAKLCLPSGVAVDDSGNVYIADRGNQRVRKVNTSGIISTIAGTGYNTAGGYGGYTGDGDTATHAELSGPIAVAVDGSGNVYIADYFNNRIREVNTAGNITTVAGNGNGTFSGDSASATSASLHYPSGVAVDASGNIYIADTYNQRIRIVNSSNGAMFTFAGNGNNTPNPTGWFGGDAGPATSAQLSGPTGVCADIAGNVYIADQQNNRIRKVIK